MLLRERCQVLLIHIQLNSFLLLSGGLRSGGKALGIDGIHTGLGLTNRLWPWLLFFLLLPS